MPSLEEEAPWTPLIDSHTCAPSDPQDTGSHEALAEGLKAESEQIGQETWAFDLTASLPL